MNLNKFLIALIMILTLPFSVGALNVFMAGDSHVTSKLYPDKVEEILKKDFPDAKFSYYGKVALSFNNFKKNTAFLNELAKTKADVLVIHMGTNDSYFLEFSASRFTKDLTAFYDYIHTKYPSCRIVLVSPYYNKVKDKKSGKWVENESTRRCADAMLEFAKTHEGIYVIDNNADFGKDIYSPKLMRGDNVHLTVEGYNRLGEMVGTRLVKIMKQ